MKRIFFILAFSLFLVSLIQAQKKYDLPKGSLVIETQPVNAQRILVLWMQNAQTHPREGNDFYTCPEYTRGSYYEGKTRVSLVDSKTLKIISSIEINDGEQADGTLDIPYLIERHFYQVPAINAKKEGKPQIMALKDYNGDGKAQEFALFDKESCQGLATTLIGYDEKKDKIIQYPIQLTDDGKTETVYWVDELFLNKPISKGYWKYEIDYRGRGGSLDKYEISYDKATERFSGTLKSITDDK